MNTIDLRMTAEEANTTSIKKWEEILRIVQMWRQAPLDYSINLPKFFYRTIFQTCGYCNYYMERMKDVTHGICGECPLYNGNHCRNRIWRLDHADITIGRIRSICCIPLQDAGSITDRLQSLEQAVEEMLQAIKDNPIIEEN